MSFKSLTEHKKLWHSERKYTLHRKLYQDRHCGKCILATKIKAVSINYFTTLDINNNKVIRIIFIHIWMTLLQTKIIMIIIMIIINKMITGIWQDNDDLPVTGWEDMKCTLRCDREGFVVTKRARMLFGDREYHQYKNDLTLLFWFTCRLWHRDLYPCCGNQKAWCCVVRWWWWESWKYYLLSVSPQTNNASSLNIKPSYTVTQVSHKQSYFSSSLRMPHLFHLMRQQALLCVSLLIID